MTTDCDLRLTSYGPIVEVLYRLELKADGWTLWSRHRHYSGLFGDCGSTEYTRLTMEEVQDVITVGLFLTDGPGLA